MPVRLKSGWLCVIPVNKENILYNPPPALTSIEIKLVPNYAALKAQLEEHSMPRRQDSIPAQKAIDMVALESCVTDMLDILEPDPGRSGISETPARVAKALMFATGGYDQDPVTVLKTFEDGAAGVDEMIVVSGIKFWSQCEHHMMPFFGEATIAYIPQGKILGLSKFARLVDVFARRLQVQERMTTDIANVLHGALNPLGVAVCTHARHACMESRGICKHGAVTTMQKLTGVFKTDPTVRAEFSALTRFDGHL